MLTLEEARRALNEYYDRLPPEISRELNGGISLVPQHKVNPQGRGDDLLILGEYHHDPGGLGRYITLYYGSFERVYGHLPDHLFRDQLRKTLYHELTHHLESLAGDRSLEVEDAKQLAAYKARFRDEK